MGKNLKTDAARRAVGAMRVRGMSAHEHGLEISRRNIDWARCFGLVDNDIDAARARKIRVGDLAAYVNSRESVPITQLTADLVLWLFLFDDAVGECDPDLDERAHRDVLVSYLEVVRGERLGAHSSPLYLALLDLVLRARSLGATDAWMARFERDLSGYFEGCAREPAHRRAKKSPGVEAYRELRALSVGTSPAFAIIELGRAGIVDDDEMSREDVREIRKTAALLTAWVNDVYSYPKESAAGDPLNLVIVLCSLYEIEPAVALELATEIYNLDLLEFERMALEVEASGCSVELREYFRGLADWIHGNRVWTKLCGRYF